MATIDVTPESLWTEIEGAEQARDKHLDTYLDQSLSRYAGPGFKGFDTDSDEYWPENHAYEYLRLMVPRMIWDNPRVRLTSRRPGPQAEAARALQYGMNRWIDDTQLWKLLEKAAYDYCWNYSVLLTTLEVRPEMHEPEDPKMWPACYRIPQPLFFADPMARDLESPLFQGHTWYAPRKSIMERARQDKELPEEQREGWDLRKLEALQSNAGLEDAVRSEKYKETTHRDYLVFKDIYVPGHELESSEGPSKGYNGTWFTLAVGENNSAESAVFPRKPRAFYGPRWGPYTVTGCYMVPDEYYPLGPLAAMDGQIEDLNKMSLAVRSSVDAYKRIIIASEKDPQLQQRIKDGEHDFVFPANVDDIRANVVGLEIGGATEQMYHALDRRKDQLDRSSGITAAQRGSVTGEGTATEVSVAAEASETSTGWVVRKFHEGVVRVLKTVGHHLYHDDLIVFPLGSEAGEELGMEDPVYHGGMPEEGSGLTYDDLEIEIEPMSMRRTTEESMKASVMQMSEFVMQTAPMMPQMPWVSWKELYERLGDALNMPDLGELVDPDMALQFQGAPPGPPTSKESGGLITRQLGAAGVNRRVAPQPQAGPSSQAKQSAPSPGGSQADTVKVG